MLLEDLKITVSDHTGFKYLEKNDSISKYFSVRIFLKYDDFKNIKDQYYLISKKKRFLQWFYAAFLFHRLEENEFIILNKSPRSHILIVLGDSQYSRIPDSYEYFEFALGLLNNKYANPYNSIYKREMIKILTENERIIKGILE